MRPAQVIQNEPPDMGRTSKQNSPTPDKIARACWLAGRPEGAEWAEEEIKCNTLRKRQN